VSQADDWRPVATKIVQTQLVLGLASALAILLLADPIASALGDARLARYLRLFAVNIPLFNMVVTHRQILIGLSRFRSRAASGAVYWLSRLVLVILLVELFRQRGLALEAALIGMIGASVAELLLLRSWVRPRIWIRSDVSLRVLTGYMAPLFLNAVSLKLFDRLDLLMFKGMVGSTVEAGILGAAKNLALVPGLLTVAFVPLLISTMTSVLKQSRQDAVALAEKTLRVAILALPFTALAAGSANEIVLLIFGEQYAGAGPLLAILLISTTSAMTISTAVGLLIAAGKPRSCLAIGPPLMCLAIMAHLLVIPRWHVEGAVSVTASISVLGAFIGARLIYGEWGVRIRPATLIRTLLVAAVLFAAGRLWSTPGAWVLVKLTLLSLTAFALLVAIREVSRDEVAMLGKALIGKYRPSAPKETR
jgi:O-antigen/teichoic acid export membrane protein